MTEFRKPLIKLATAGAMFASILAISGTANAACGEVTIAEMNWASAELMANVDDFILSNGYDCETSLIPGATQTTFASMNEKSQPDVAPELWTNALTEPLALARKEERLFSLNPAPITGLGEGWWITPKTAAEHPELKTVLDIIERPDLFPDAEDSSKGALIGCPAGWGCQLSNANLFRAFEMEKKGWVLVDPGSAAGLDGSMTKAVERGQNWFGYYWTPTSIIGKHKMVNVPFGVPFAGREHWDNCLAQSEQDCADPRPSAYTESEVQTVVTKKFLDAGGPAVDYLSKRVFPGDIMNEMLVYMADNQAGGADAAVEFLKKHEAIWTTWVSGDVTAKVKAALSSS